MDTKVIIIIVLAVILTSILSILAFYGTFDEVKIEVKEVGGETVVYQEITGDYMQSGVVMDEIYYYLLDDLGIETTKGWGIYYDNPQKVEKEKLRSEAGSIINEEDVDKVNALELNYKVKTLPTKEYITAEFPYKNKMSIMFSLMKVYPALAKYVKENNHTEDTPVMEIYDIPNKKILYRKELN